MGEKSVANASETRSEHRPLGTMNPLLSAFGRVLFEKLQLKLPLRGPCKRLKKGKARVAAGFKGRYEDLCSLALRVAVRCERFHF